MVQLRHEEPSLEKNIKVFNDLKAITTTARPRQFQRPRPQMPQVMRGTAPLQRIASQSWQTSEASKFYGMQKAN